MQVEGAHMCYLLAGLVPQFYEPTARMCLLGADHTAHARTYASVPAFQRTEALEWAKATGGYLSSSFYQAHPYSLIVRAWL